MAKRQVVTNGIVLAAALAVALIAGTGSAMAASNNCSRVGTWYGLGDSGISWIATDTPGVSATVGQITLEWSVIDPTLGGFFPTVVRATNAVGVWEKVNQTTYKYTWVAYGLDGGGLPVYVARASGIASMAGCDKVNLTYLLELFDPAQDMSKDDPFFWANGTGAETRMPLVQPVRE